MVSAMAARQTAVLAMLVLASFGGCLRRDDSDDPFAPGKLAFGVKQTRGKTSEVLRLSVLPEATAISDWGKEMPVISFRLERAAHDPLVFHFAASDLSFVSASNVKRNLTYFAKEDGPLAPGPYGAIFSFLPHYELQPSPVGELGGHVFALKPAQEEVFGRTDCRSYSVDLGLADSTSPIFICLDWEGGKIRAAARDIAGERFVFTFDETPLIDGAAVTSADQPPPPEIEAWQQIPSRSGKILMVPPTGHGSGYDLSRYVAAASKDDGMEQRGISAGTFLNEATWTFEDSFLGLIRPEFQWLPTRMGAVYFSGGGRQTDLVRVETIRLGSEDHDRVVASTRINLALDLPQRDELPEKLVTLAWAERQYLHLLPKKPQDDGPSPERRWWTAYEHVAAPGSPAAAQWLLTEGCLTRANGKHESKTDLTYLVVSAVTGRLLILGKAQSERGVCAYEFASYPPQYHGAGRG